MNTPSNAKDLNDQVNEMNKLRDVDNLHSYILILLENSEEKLVDILGIEKKYVKTWINTVGSYALLLSKIAKNGNPIHPDEEYTKTVDDFAREEAHKALDKLSRDLAYFDTTIISIKNNEDRMYRFSELMKEGSEHVAEYYTRPSELEVAYADFIHSIMDLWGVDGKYAPGYETRVINLKNKKKLISIFGLPNNPTNYDEEVA